MAAFGDDPGTLWLSRDESISVADGRGWRNAWRLRKLASGRPIVWIVDDEQAHREWFRRSHGDHFAVITFSSRQHVLSALRRRIPCDAVVSDIFFPKNKVQDDDQANELLAIYPAMEKANKKQMRELWDRVQKQDIWLLDGFNIAADTTRHRKGDAPVFLYSRKAALLLDAEELAGYGTEPNVYWQPFKPRPSSDVAGGVVIGQRENIEKVIRERKQLRLARRFWRIVGLLGRLVGLST